MTRKTSGSLLENWTSAKKYPERYRWIHPHTTFDYIAPKDSNMYDLHVRVVRVQISGRCYETVYTNLDSKTFPIEKIKAL